MDDIYKELKDTLRDFFQEFANLYGLKFEETYSAVFDDHWVIRFSDEKNGRHCEYWFDANSLNAMYHLSKQTILLNFATPLVRKIKTELNLNQKEIE